MEKYFGPHFISFLILKHRVGSSINRFIKNAKVKYILFNDMYLFKVSSNHTPIYSRTLMYVFQMVQLEGEATRVCPFVHLLSPLSMLRCKPFRLGQSGLVNTLIKRQSRFKFISILGCWVQFVI